MSYLKDLKNKIMNKRITYFDREKNILVVFRFGKTTNKKIAESSETIVQTYSFSLDQFAYVRNCVDLKIKIEPSKFFSLADSVCFDCPFKSYGKCYTHKYMQFSGFVSMLKSIKKEFENYSFSQLPTLNQVRKEIVKYSVGKYIRFGTYGEPSLIPIDLVSDLCYMAKNWTGYTHQWMRKPEYSSYFMASTHSQNGANIATLKGYQSFIVLSDLLDLKTAINCPASKEQGFKSNCSKCGLCSGTQGKGNKNVQILNH